MRLTLLSILLLHEASALVATTLAKPSAASSFAPPESSIVVGAGPAGLATAIMLSKRGWQNVQVFDRRCNIPSACTYAYIPSTVCARRYSAHDGRLHTVLHTCT